MTTHTTTYTITVPANPYLICSHCKKRVEGFVDRPGRVTLYPCWHSEYEDICPSWGPVDGCSCVEHLGYRPHGDAQRATTEEGIGQGPY
jgi:hypothetical protein